MTSITQTTGGTKFEGATSQGTGAKPKAASDYQTFLKMLTAQIRNQDPLNPLESTDFAEQLATFSGVEQQVKTNDLLESLADRMGASGLSGIAGWVGREARSTGSVPYDGKSALTLSIDPVDSADQAVLIALFPDGTEAYRKPVSLTKGDYSWPPSGANDILAGDYAFKLESFKNGQKLGASADVPVWRSVSEVRTGSDGAVLVFADGKTSKPGDITGLRN